jgi:hypothetical protein
LNFKPYNISCTTQTCKDFIQASKIHSELPLSTIAATVTLGVPQ